ncbi:predicted protein [Sclerotinia sclerotiorum 1980 UF-70]|uniref:Uncharacterized protein n=1 Tax=Sclerotinia sclerotiorum (strain ATCC 18683 / 1980 / Ss-1) TaxID=665079 RepID=A7EA54_SCLS1|nr:predicted protein [Sclerotinia sclerotiorum 1980 UF-70]EDN99332.1 predicted protein [Sclerotinia sclerotiorum 1980 UF-70]
MPTFGFWRSEENPSKPKKKHHQRPPPKIISIRSKLHPVFHAPGVNVSPQNHYSTHAIEVLKEGNWESLPVEQFRERHVEVKKVGGGGDFEDKKRRWERGVDRATRHFDYSGDALTYRETLKELGPKLRLSSEAKQARYLDKIMNDVGAALYSKHEEPRKILDKYRRRAKCSASSVLNTNIASCIYKDGITSECFLEPLARGL